MATFTNTVKNSAIATNISKNVASFIGQVKSHNAYQFITTDTPDFVLVGASEDEFLVWDTPTLFTNLAKS